MQLIALLFNTSAHFALKFFVFQPCLRLATEIVNPLIIFEDFSIFRDSLIPSTCICLKQLIAINCVSQKSIH